MLGGCLGPAPTNSGAILTNNCLNNKSYKNTFLGPVPLLGLFICWALLGPLICWTLFGPFDVPRSKIVENIIIKILIKINMQITIEISILIMWTLFGHRVLKNVIVESCDPAEAGFALVGTLFLCVVQE